MKPFNQRWQRFLSRRIPPSSEVVLNQRRLFIFPTRAGFFFLLCLLVMLMAAINYQNNMSYALTFLLANLFVIAVLHTFANLSGVRLRSAGSQGVFAGQLAQFTFNLDATGKANRHTIVVEWPGVSQAQLAQVSDAPQSVVLSCEVGERGWYKAPRIKVSSVYPLGLLRCWSGLISICEFWFTPGLLLQRPTGSHHHLLAIDVKKKVQQARTFTRYDLTAKVIL